MTERGPACPPPATTWAAGTSGDADSRCFRWPMRARPGYRNVHSVTGEEGSGERSPAVPRSWVLDLTAAAILTAFFLLGSGHSRPPAGGHEFDLFGYLLLVLAGISVAVCRRFPRLVLAVVVLVLACYLGRSYPNGPIYLAGMTSLLALSLRADRRTALLGAVTLVVTLTVVAGTLRDSGVSVLPLIFVGWSA